MNGYGLITRFLALLVIFVAAGCADDNVVLNKGTGLLSLNIDCNPTVVMPDGSKVAIDQTYVPSSSQWSVSMTDDSGEYSHTWTSVSDFNNYDSYLAGTYTISVTSETLTDVDPSHPIYYGETSFIIKSGDITNVTLSPQLANVPIRSATTPEFSKAFPDARITLHCQGDAYIEAIPDNSISFINPGDINLFITLDTKMSPAVTLVAMSIDDAPAQYVHDITLDYDSSTSSIIVSCNSAKGNTAETLAITHDVMGSAAPEIITNGFEPEVPVDIVEGNLPATPLTMTLTPGSGLRNIMLSVNSQFLNGCGMPREFDLLNMTDGTKEIATNLGLGYSTLSTTGGIIDFSNLAATIVTENNEDAMSTFTVTTIDNLGRTSTPTTLTINTLQSKMSIISVDRVTVGDPTATFTFVAGNDFPNNGSIEISADGGNEWAIADIVQLTTDEDGNYRVTISLPDGTNPIDVRLMYRGSVRDIRTIDRHSPAYSIAVDPFANIARIRIIPNNPEQLEMITNYASIYASDEELPVISRDPATGDIMVLGLKPATTYKFKASIMQHPAANDYTEEVTATTEKMASLPNADFEDVKESIKWEDLPSGGRYSQNRVAIFNCQNRVSHRLSTPVKGWANTNAKTFCKSASNKNSWYMQPSAFTVDDAVSGAYAVELVSVGYDIDGQPIPDYLQESEPFISYSRNIPQVAHRAAGKLFLGEYSFSPATGTETYKEGIGFTSRPISINGYYKFVPSANSRNERALVKVEVLGMVNGEETVIGGKEHHLTMATGYTTFAINIDYPVFGVKATRLKVMFASSTRVGSTTDEDDGVTVYFDPVTASATGNRLWIDNITLGY